MYEIQNPYILPSISKNQIQIVENLKQNNNIIVESVAGSGKTTTILHCATLLYNIKILLLTYNAKLKYFILIICIY